MYFGQFQSNEMTSMKNSRSTMRWTSGFGELRDEFGMLARVLDAGVAENLQAFAMRIIHEEQRDAVVRGEIAGGKHLAVALVIGERELSSDSRPAGIRAGRRDAECKASRSP